MSLPSLPPPHPPHPTRRIPTRSQVGFHEDKLVKKTQVARRLNEIVNRLNKSKVGGGAVQRGWQAGSSGCVCVSWCVCGGGSTCERCLMSAP